MSNLETKMKIYSIYDTKAEAYMQPWYARTKGEALRSFEQAVNDPQSQLSKHPSDFTLFELGEFDEQMGILTPNLSKYALGTAIEFKKQENLRPLTPVNN